MSDLQQEALAASTYRLAGEIDLATADTIAAAADAAVERGTPVLTFDLEDVTFMDSQGLRALVNAHRALARVGASLRLTGVPPRVVDLLELTGLRQFFGVT